MSKSPPNQASLKDRLTVEIKRSPKKAAVLATLVALLLILVGHELIKRAGPAKASAAPK